MANLKDIRSRIGSVQNVRKITRAMEMISAARLRRAEQRIEHLRPYADALRRMTARASHAADNIPNLPILQDRENVETVGILLITGDRGLAGPFNSQIVRAGNRRAAELKRDGKNVLWYAVGRRGVSSLEFRQLELGDSWTGFTDRPAFADARTIGDGMAAAYVDGKVDRVEIIYNGYISPVNQEVREETLLPLQQADVIDVDEEGARRGRVRLARALDLRARPRGDPRAARAGLRGDFDLQGAARVDGVRARRPHERHAQRIRQRRRAHRRPYPGRQPAAPGRDHPGDHGGRRRGRGTSMRINPGD